MYWADETRYAPIADLTSINWYQPLREYLQVKDDLKLDKPPNKSIILCQIHPVQDHVSKNCRYIKQRWTITEKDIKKRNRVCSKHRIDANLDNKVV